MRKLAKIMALVAVLAAPFAFTGAAKAQAYDTPSYTGYPAGDCSYYYPYTCNGAYGYGAPYYGYPGYYGGPAVAVGWGGWWGWHRPWGFGWGWGWGGRGWAGWHGGWGWGHGWGHGWGGWHGGFRGGGHFRHF